MLEKLVSRRNLIIFILLCSVQMFTLIIFPRQTMAGIEAVGGFLLIFLVILYSIYYKPVNPIKKYFSFEVNMLIFAVLMSMPMAYYFQSQGYFTTFFAMKFTFYFLLYHLLHYFEIDGKIIVKVFVILGVAWLTIFLVQWLIYPVHILNSRIQFDRGTVRIFFPGGVMAGLAYWYYLQKSLTEKFKFGYLAFMLLYFVVTGILQGTRQSLVTITFFTGLFILLNKNIKSKALILFLSIIMSVSIVVLFYEIIMGMLSVTEAQMETRGDPIRVRSIKFFTGDFMQHLLTYIFGNGMDHGSSPYGMRIFYYKSVYGFYQSDIGIIGDYSRFGIFYVLGQLFIIFRILFMKMPKSLTFVKYRIGIIMFTMFTGSGNYGNSGGIAGMMLMLYYVDYEMNKVKLKENTS